MNTQANPQQVVIDIESDQLEVRKKKNGGTYTVQTAYVHTTDRNGKPNRYPEQISVFPPMDNAGNHVAFKKGQYHIAPQTFRVNNGFLELGFLNLNPVRG